jgi:putative heme-binding domain-containing protein
MDISKSLKEMGVVDAKPKQGDFGIQDARLVAPGEPFRSVLLYRMAKFGHGRMPHLGSEMPHPAAVELVANWIRSMGPEPTDGLKLPVTSTGFLNASGRLETALPYAVALGSGHVKGREREWVLSTAAKLPPGPVRELFDGYLPPDSKARRLGSNPRPAAILAMTGDAKRGEAVFFTEALQCAKCHKVADKGVSLGPDLSAIGKMRTKPELLESILQPSVRVEPQFASYLVKTVDGRSFTGLLVKRDEKQVVLKDAENKEIVLTPADVESVQPSRLSLMPDGLASGLTPQEAADLLEYLASRRAP